MPVGRNQPTVPVATNEGSGIPEVAHCSSPPADHRDGSKHAGPVREPRGKEAQRTGVGAFTNKDGLPCGQQQGPQTALSGVTPCPTNSLYPAAPPEEDPSKTSPTGKGRNTFEEALLYDDAFRADAVPADVTTRQARDASRPLMSSAKRDGGDTPVTRFEDAPVTTADGHGTDAMPMQIGTGTVELNDSPAKSSVSMLSTACISQSTSPQQDDDDDDDEDQLQDGPLRESWISCISTSKRPGSPESWGSRLQRLQVAEVPDQFVAHTASASSKTTAHCEYYEDSGESEGEQMTRPSKGKGKGRKGQFFDFPAPNIDDAVMIAGDLNRPADAFEVIEDDADEDSEVESVSTGVGMSDNSDVISIAESNTKAGEAGSCLLSRLLSREETPQNYFMWKWMQPWRTSPPPASGEGAEGPTKSGYPRV